MSQSQSQHRRGHGRGIKESSRGGPSAAPGGGVGGAQGHPQHGLGPHKAPGRCAADLGTEAEAKCLLAPLFCEKQEARTSEQSAGEERGQGLREGKFCHNSAGRQSRLEQGPGMARVHCMAILGAISLPGAVSFLGRHLAVRCELREQRAASLQGCGSTRRAPCAE